MSLGGWGEFGEVGQDCKITRLSFDNHRLSFDISDVLGTGIIGIFKWL